MNDRLLAWLRIGFGLLVVAAVITQIAVLVDLRIFNPFNFFSFFTVLSNSLAAAIFLEGGRRLLTGGAPVPATWRGAAVVYMTVTYIVFALLLRDLQEQLQTNVVWVDTVLHRIMPIIVMLDWLIDPPREPIPFRRALVWLAFPLVWTGYTLIRGPIVDWYPYPFLNPANGGYGTVALYSIVIFVGVVAVIWVVASIGSTLGARRAAA
jgi:hypothetical protein